MDAVTSIAEARKHKPDPVILDLGLPAGDGFTMLERLKAIDGLSLIPVTVRSGNDLRASSKIPVHNDLADKSSATFVTFGSCGCEPGQTTPSHEINFMASSTEMEPTALLPSNSLFRLFGF